MVKRTQEAKMQTLLDSNNGFSGSNPNHIPAFLAKLWKIVDDPSTNDLIYWSEHGNSFLIRNQSKFARELLPSYYKHNNMASFVRQLNMYGFHKVVSVEQGGLKVDKDEMEFAHPFFLRGSESTLELIKRKISTAKLEDTRTARPDTINKVILDVRHMKGRQDSMDSKLMSVKRENEALWRELSILRQKHVKQQQIVSKLLQFLVGMMSTQGHRLGFKRRMPMTIPLMLSDGDSLKDAKIPKNSDSLAGPVIHDVTDIAGFRGVADLGLSGLENLSPSSDSQGKVDSPVSLVDQVDDIPYTCSSYSFSPSAAGSEVEPDVNSVGGEPSSSMLVPSKTLPDHADLFTDDTKQYKSTKDLAKGKSATVPHCSKQSIQTHSYPSKSVPESRNSPKPAIKQRLPPNIADADVRTLEMLTFSGQGELPTAAGISPKEVLQTGSEDELPESALSTIAGYEDLSIPQSSLQLGLPDNLNVENIQLDEEALRHHLDGHVDDVQNGLDNLKNLLKEDIALDRSTLMTLFGTEAERPKDGSLTKERESGVINPDEGLNLVAYNPSLYELAEDDSLFGYENDSRLLDEELESMLTTDRENLMKVEAQLDGSCSN